MTVRTKPRFLMTGKVQLEVRRKGKGYFDDDGFWVDAPDTITFVEANVQPLNSRDLLLMAESERTKEWIKIYSAEEIRQAKEGPGGYQADHVLWDGELFRVMQSKNYKMGPLDHWKAQATRVPLSAQG